MKESSVINQSDEHGAPALVEEPAPVEPGVAPFRLQPDTELSNVNSYALTDLLSYHDKTFVLNAYAAISKRHPSPSELTQSLQELRSGRRNKTEIIEHLCAKYPDVRVDGLPSPTLRRMSRWPGVGYILTVLRAIGRLPLLIQHQQQFESYITGQQQRMADHVNNLFVATGPTGSDLATRQNELAENVSDAVKTVMMLSDSLIELSANLVEGESSLLALQTQHEKVEAEFRNSLAELHEQLAMSVHELQKQREQSEMQLHSDLVALTAQLTVQQEQLAELRGAADVAANAQRELLIDEQRIIVEAQRAAFSDLEEQFTQSSREQAVKIEELSAELSELRSVVKKLKEAGLRK